MKNIINKVTMERTVKELRTLAKNAGLRGYSRMRKADLVAFLEENYILSRNILDAPVPNIGTSILQPTPYVPPVPLQKQQQQQQRQQDWSFLDVPQPAPRRSDRLKKLQKNIKELYKQKEKPFEINETKSALNRFATQYKIDGRSGYERKNLPCSNQTACCKSFSQKSPNKSCVSSSMHDGENKLANGRNSGERSSILVWCRS